MEIGGLLPDAIFEFDRSYDSKMLQWMGGSRRKVTASRGSTQKRQKQYFEQRRRQQQQQTSGLDNFNLEDNVCSTSNGERRSLDVLSLKTLSTVAQECSSRCVNDSAFKGLEAAGMNDVGNKLEVNASQLTIIGHSGNRGKDPVDFASKEKTVCDLPYSNEMKTSNANLDPWKNDRSVLDILEDDDLKYNFRENPMSEDHVSFSVGGVGEVGTETPSPPHRMTPHGGSFRSNVPRGVEMSRNHLNDLEFEVDSGLQDTDTYLSGKSSKFSSYSSDQVERFENKRASLCFPVDVMPFDKYGNSLGGAICGKRAYDGDEDYKKNRYFDDLYDAKCNRPWEDGPRRGYISEDSWESQNLQEDPFKRPLYFGERETGIPLDSFNFADTMFTTFHAPERSINFEEVLQRGPSVKMNFESVSLYRKPSQFLSPVEDPKDSSMSSEESCSSSAVRRDIMGSVANNSEIFNNIWSPKGHGKCFPREETSHGYRSYAQQIKTTVESKADADNFDTSSLPSEMPSPLTGDIKVKPKDGGFGTREKPESDIDSDLTPFYKNSNTTSKAYKKKQWAEGFTGALADSKLCDRPILDDWKSRYSPHERAPCIPFMESHNLPLKSGVQCIPTGSFGVIESPATYKPPPSLSGYPRNDGEMEIEHPLAGVLDCKPRNQKKDFFAVGMVQVGDKEGCSYQSDRKSLKGPAGTRYPEFQEVMKSSASIVSDKFLITENENENQHKEHPKCVNLSKDCIGYAETETAAVDNKEQRTAVMKNIASSLDRVLMHQSYFIQFMCATGFC